MRLILVVALLCFFSPISSASVSAARLICAELADGGVRLMKAREAGAAKHVFVERAHELYNSGQVNKPEAEAVLWVIEYVYKSDETHETIRQPMFKACMKEMGYSGA